jgi:hypothetical protein
MTDQPKYEWRGERGPELHITSPGSRVTVQIPDVLSWIEEHYDLGYDPTIRDYYRRCRRCGMDVWAVTKHAAHVHGDPIEVMPPTPSHAHLTTDHEGRLIEA